MLKWILIIMLPLSLIFFASKVSNHSLVHSNARDSKKQSSIVYFDQDSFLRYVTDAENNYIPDFSYAGYKNGEIPIPEVPVIDTIGPIDGDNTAWIQSSLNKLGSFEINSTGMRGALLLLPGKYEIHGTLMLNEDGIVLRGSGNGSDPSGSTILLGMGNTPTSRDIIRVGGDEAANWDNKVMDSQSTITSQFIPAGSRSLEVSDPSLYKLNDQIIVFQPSTTAWLESVNFGDTDVDEPWRPGQIDLYFNRYIKAINLSENKIVLNTPIYDHLDRSLAPVFVYKLDTDGFRRNIGIENLRIDIQTKGQFSEDHAQSAIQLIGVEDCWVKNVTALHFSFAAIDMTFASRISIIDCNALQPHSRIEGSRRYNFNVSSQSNNILFQNCLATDARHAFISNGTSSASGIVFQECFAKGDYTTSEGHRRWSQAMLFDNITFTEARSNNLMGLYNRGSYGTSHGWASVHSVAWNVVVPSSKRIVLQKPPGRQNYAIGCQAEITNIHRFVHPIGFHELTNETLAINSLYSVQLDQRLTKGTGPDAPARLFVQKRGDGVQLSWLDISSQESGYVIEYSSDGGSDFIELGRVPTNSTSYFFSGTTQPVDGLYRVYAYKDHAPPSPFSNVASLDLTEYYLFETLADVTEPDKQNKTNLQPGENPEIAYRINVQKFSVYPNPAQDIITVRFPSALPKGQLSLCDSRGNLLYVREVFPKENHELILTFEDGPLVQGLLLIKFENDHILMTEKLMFF